MSVLMLDCEWPRQYCLHYHSSALLLQAFSSCLTNIIVIVYTSKRSLLLCLHMTLIERSDWSNMTFFECIPNSNSSIGLRQSSSNICHNWLRHRYAKSHRVDNFSFVLSSFVTQIISGFFLIFFIGDGVSNVDVYKRNFYNHRHCLRHRQ